MHHYHSQDEHPLGTGHGGQGQQNPRQEARPSGLPFPNVGRQCRQDQKSEHRGLHATHGPQSEGPVDSQTQRGDEGGQGIPQRRQSEELIYQPKDGHTEKDAQADGHWRWLKAEPHEEGQYDRPQEVGVSLNPLASVEYQTITCHQVLRVTKGDVGVVNGICAQCTIVECLVQQEDKTR